MPPLDYCYIGKHHWVAMHDSAILKLREDYRKGRSWSEFYDEWRFPGIP
jgi:hypothetical protein